MSGDPDFGDIVLNGKPYRIILEGARFKDIVDFSPRAATPGGSILMSELALYQPQLQTDWRAGFGFPWYQEDLGYMRTIGNIDTRHDGIAMLFSAMAASDSVDLEGAGYCTFNGFAYRWGAAPGSGISGLRKYSTGSWADIAKAATGDYGAINFVLAAGNYLFVCPDGGRIEKVSTSDVATVTGVDANAIDYKWLVVHRGFVYAGVDGTNRVHYDDTSDLSTLEGTTADPNAIYVGNAGYPTLGAISLFGKLYAFKADGMWEVDEANKAHKVLDYSQEASSVNFRSWASHLGLLIFPLRNQVFQWNGSRLSNITPRRMTDTFPYVTYGAFDNFVAVGDFLYCTGKRSDDSTTDLLSYDGAGWHKLAALTTASTQTVTALGFDTANNYLWVHVSGPTTSEVTSYFPFQELSELPYASFPTTGQHSLILSRWDMGFRRIIKSMPSVVIEGENLSAATYLRVYYSLDGGAWVLWDDVKTDGITELENPGGNETVEFHHLILRIDFITSTSAQSPILESVTVRFLMRPDELYGHAFDIVVEKDLKFGQRIESRTVATIIADLKAARNSKKPIPLVDPSGVTHRAYVTAVQGRYVRRSPSGQDGKPSIAQVVSVNLAELV